MHAHSIRDDSILLDIGEAGMLIGEPHCQIGGDSITEIVLELSNEAI